MKKIKSKINKKSLSGSLLLLREGITGGCDCLWKGLVPVFLFSALSGTVKKAVSQDMHFTQFYSSPLFLNPAFTGASRCSRLSATYRNQWPGISKTYSSFLASADHYLHDQNLGVGILLGSDIAGTGQLKTTLINPSIAYEARLSRKFTIRFGAQPGFTLKSINFNNLLFGDQLARGGNISTIETPAQSKLFFDVGAGILAYTTKYWGGVSAFHLNRPNESLMGNETTKLPVKYSVHGGAKFMINKLEEKEEFQKKSTTMAFNYRGQKEFDQLDIGVYYSQNGFNLGFWYRGIPALKMYKPGYENNDAVAVIIGFQTKKMNIGYSYDITISKLYKISNGAHEITIYYQICKPPKKKKYGLMIPCPKF